MRWRKQGSEQWQSTDFHIDGTENNELVFMYPFVSLGGRRFKCAACGNTLYHSYVLYGPVPRTEGSDRRYCPEHSPIPIEIQ